MCGGCSMYLCIVLYSINTVGSVSLPSNSWVGYKALICSRLRRISQCKVGAHCLAFSHALAHFGNWVIHSIFCSFPTQYSIIDRRQHQHFCCFLVLRFCFVCLVFILVPIILPISILDAYTLGMLCKLSTV